MPRPICALDCDVKRIGYCRITRLPIGLSSKYEDKYKIRLVL